MTLCPLFPFSLFFYVLLHIIEHFVFTGYVVWVKMNERMNQWTSPQQIEVVEFGPITVCDRVAATAAAD